MLVKDMMSGRVITVRAEESAATAARLLARHNIGALPVCGENGRLRGVVTDRDIILRCVAADEDPAQTRVADIMTRRIVSVSPDETADCAAQRMAQEQVRRLPVTRDGQLVGMLSLSDFARLPDFSVEAAAALSEISLNVHNR